MKNIISAARLVLFLLLPINAYAQDEVGNFEFDGHNRQYEVYLPQNFQSNMPLVVSIHGIGETVAWYKNYTRMHEVADTMGFVIVYPQGIEKSWNAGVVNPDKIFPNSNDVGFISALIDTMKSHLNIDLSRVYCCGFSLGGHMSFRLIGDLGYRFAAVGTVSGTLFGLADTWNIIRPFPVLHMHGTSDSLIYYEGRGDRWAAQKVIDYWVEKNLCVIEADTFNFPDIVQNDNCTVQKISYTNCSGESQVVHYKGIRMGHSWPSSKDLGGSSWEGNKNMDINASVEILNFFKNYENPLVNVAYGKTIQCYPKYISTINDDTLKLVAKIYNPDNHDVDVYASILLGDSVIADSIILYDDGLHNDELSSDNIFGAKKQITIPEENFYRIRLTTSDLNDSVSTLSANMEDFTSVGPIVYESHNITSTDSTAYPGAEIIVKLALRNNGSSATAGEVKARIISLDTLTNVLSDADIFYSNMLAGESKTPPFGQFRIKIKDNCPENTEVKFLINISSFGEIYWTDTLSLMVVKSPTSIEDQKLLLPTEFALHQNYPNPFNPSTTIKYSIPNQSTVSLKVFDLLGSEVATLINKEQSQGNYEVEFDGSDLTSGIYFYRLQGGDASTGSAQGFVKTRKMILIK